MAIRFLLDENLRGHLWEAILRHNSRGSDCIDVVRAGDLEDLPLGTKDPDLLVWAEREQRILVSNDRTSMPMHLADHLRSGRHCPGIFALRRSASIQRTLAFLILAAYASEPDDWRDRIEYIG